MTLCGFASLRLCVNFLRAVFFIAVAKTQLAIIGYTKMVSGVEIESTLLSRSERRLCVFNFGAKS